MPQIGEGPSAHRRSGRRRAALVAGLTAAVAALAGPASAAPLLPSGNLLANPGAEVGGAAADSSQTFPPPSWSP
ncbi:MAG: hypothetical protein QOH30_2668, partial [Baekduia sp.]|nr:hypothetical protein [Baekduia sp.]